jgi:hypothetical protein
MPVVDNLTVDTPADPYLSLRALTQYSGLSLSTIRQYLALPPPDALPAYYLPGKILVRRSDFDVWIQRFKTRGRPDVVKVLQELGLDGK